MTPAALGYSVVDTRSAVSSAATARARTISCAWRVAGGSWTGPERARPVLRRAQAPGPARLPRRAQGTGPHARATVYTLTDKGLEALRDHARTLVTFTPLKSEPLLRLLLADLVGEEVTRESLGTLREDIADLVERLDESAAAADALPHRRKYLLLVNGFLRRLVDLHLELVDEVERELAPDP
jgi:DNA-binding PadR family transcriptional regulator